MLMLSCGFNATVDMLIVLDGSDGFSVASWLWGMWLRKSSVKGGSRSVAYLLQISRFTLVVPLSTWQFLSIHFSIICLVSRDVSAMWSVTPDYR